MANHIPNYLRLHTEEAAAEEASTPESLNGVQAFCRTFTAATGWELQWEPPTSGDSNPPTLRADGGTVDEQTSAVTLTQAQDLAGAFGEVLQELESTRHELRCREAELAAGVPVGERRDEEQHLALRLESVLKGGAEAVGCQAAALYALDDATTQLKLRAAWGLPAERLTAPARPLRGEVADLEALVGHAVVLEDASLLPSWRVPEEYAAAVCVPVSSPTEPLGTLWMFCDHARPFTDEQTNLIEIIAGRVSSELQREMLLKECVTSKKLTQQLGRACEWQQTRLPNVKPLLEGWQLAGTSYSAQVMSRAFYDWFVPPNGTLGLAVGGAESSMLEGALTMSSLQSLLRAHGDYPHSTTEVLTRINESFWNSSAGGQFASLFYGTLDLDRGELSYGGFGACSAWKATGTGLEKLGIESAPLGTEANSQQSARQIVVAPSDVVAILYTTRPSLSGDDAPNVLTRSIEANRERSAEEILAASRETLLADSVYSSTDWSLLVARRLP